MGGMHWGRCGDRRAAHAPRSRARRQRQPRREEQGAGRTGVGPRGGPASAAAALAAAGLRLQPGRRRRASGRAPRKWRGRGRGARRTGVRSSSGRRPAPRRWCGRRGGVSSGGAPGVWAWAPSARVRARREGAPRARGLRSGGCRGSVRAPAGGRARVGCRACARPVCEALPMGPPIRHETERALVTGSTVAPERRRGGAGCARAVGSAYVGPPKERVERESERARPCRQLAPREAGRRPGAQGGKESHGSAVTGKGGAPGRPLCASVFCTGGPRATAAARPGRLAPRRRGCGCGGHGRHAATGEAPQVSRRAATCPGGCARQPRTRVVVARAGCCAGYGLTAATAAAQSPEMGARA
ncbi:MAG: hypothetical protein J3K34DRAFT_406690 [Monoraphidium minutum]|nr:MAG: hypothetical protein J3K34DRAFT_406690 [Monoraphidium minutum]